VELLALMSYCHRQNFSSYLNPNRIYMKKYIFEIYQCLAHHPNITSHQIFRQDSGIFPETILFCRKIIKQPTFDLKVCVNLDILAQKIQIFTTFG
jgi:hypothetical protein